MSGKGIQCLKQFDKTLFSLIDHSTHPLESNVLFLRRIAEFRNTNSDVRKTIIDEYKARYNKRELAWKFRGRVATFQMGFVFSMMVIPITGLVDVSIQTLACTSIIPMYMCYMFSSENDHMAVQNNRLLETIDNLEQIHKTESNRT